MKDFFKRLSAVKAKSLQLPRDVPQDRESLQASVKLDEISQLERIVDQYDAEIWANQNFRTEVVNNLTLTQETYQVNIYLCGIRKYLCFLRPCSVV